MYVYSLAQRDFWPWNHRGTC